MFQYRNIDIVGLDITDLFINPDRDFFNENLSNCLQIVSTPAKYINSELECLRKDNATFPVEIHLKNCVIGDQELVGCSIRDISLRRHNQDAIWKKEEKLQLALQSAELWIWEFNYKTKTITYQLQNSATSNIANNEVELAIEAWENLIHPGHMESVLERLSKLASGESRHFEAEYKIKRKNGAWDWIISSGKISKYDGDGFPHIAGGANLNISERKYAEDRMRENNESLYEAEQRLRLAQECGGVASWERDLESRGLTYYSDNLAGLFGLDTPQNISTLEGILEATHPVDREHVTKKVADSRGDIGKQFSIEYRVILPDGSIHWLASRAMITCDNNSNPAKITGTSFDITDKKNAVEELKESEERFRSAFNQSTIPMLLVSKDDAIFRVNQAMCVLTKYSEDALLRMNLLDLVHPDDQAGAKKHMKKAMNGTVNKISNESRYRTRTADTRWVSAILSA